MALQIDIQSLDAINFEKKILNFHQLFYIKATNSSDTYITWSS